MIVTESDAGSLAGANVIVFGGTGSLGQRLVARVLEGQIGLPSELTVFSRDEAKQYQMKIDFEHLASKSTEEIIYKKGPTPLKFCVGDVRDTSAVEKIVRRADFVFNTAALKQVPTCEYSPFEAVKTNCLGMQNIIDAALKPGSKVKLVLGISTDKACKPVNVMGMTKAIQERMLVQANLQSDTTRFGAVRYGNVLASRGSVVPLFLDQISRGGPVTVTTEFMTRFLLTLDQAVDTIFESIKTGMPGEILVPIIDSAKIIDVAKAMIGELAIDLRVTGIRPGEKEHEIMISEEESYRTFKRGDYYAIMPMLPELQTTTEFKPFEAGTEYNSRQTTLDQSGIVKLLIDNDLIPSSTFAAI